MTVNSSSRGTIGDSLEALYGLKLTEENLKNIRLNFKRLLKQFHLLGIYEPDDVFNEAVIRFMKTLQKGKRVPKPEAWFNTTGFNIVRELSRMQKKYRTVEPNTLESEVASDEEISLALEKQEKSERTHEALMELKSEDRELLMLQFFEGLSYPEIAQHLAQKEQNVSASTLRKRMQRAKEKFGEVYSKNYDKLP